MSRLVKTLVVYHDPSDYPGKHVVREHYVGSGVHSCAPEPHCVVDTLDEARAHVTPGMVRIDRESGDDTCMVEMYV